MVTLNIEHLLKVKEKSKYGLVKALNTNYTVINNMIKHNTESIHFKTIEALLDFFDCRIEELFIVEKNNVTNPEHE